MYLLRQFCLLLGMAMTVLSCGDIEIECKKTSVLVTWKVNRQLALRPSRLFLGSCFPSQFSRTPDGGGRAVFESGLSDCGFRQKRTKLKVIYENEMAYRPLPKPNPAAFIYPFECAYERPKWMHPFVKPHFADLQSEGSLEFTMGLLNDDLNGPAPSSFFLLGSLINIWAALKQEAHQPVRLYLQECLASTSTTLEPGSPVYPFITNKGCLVDSKFGHSRFLPRHNSSVLLQLQAFGLALDQELYIHCTLVVWDPDDLNEEKKACNYNKDIGKWELLDDPSQNELCQCCEYGCARQGLLSEFKGPEQNIVFGPIIVTASSRDFYDISKR